MNAPGVLRCAHRLIAVEKLRADGIDPAAYAPKSARAEQAHPRDFNKRYGDLGP